MKESLGLDPHRKDLSNIDRNAHLIKEKEVESTLSENLCSKSGAKFRFVEGQIAYSDIPPSKLKTKKRGVRDAFTCAAIIFIAVNLFLFVLYPQYSPFVEKYTIRVHYRSGSYEDYKNVVTVDVVDVQYVDLGEYSYQTLTIRLHFAGGSSILLDNVDYFEELRPWG